MIKLMGLDYPEETARQSAVSHFLRLPHKPRVHGYAFKTKYIFVRGS